MAAGKARRYVRPLRSKFGTGDQTTPSRLRGEMSLTSNNQAGNSIGDRQEVPAAHASHLYKTYGVGQSATHALDGVTLTFERGWFTAVMGPSGSGKSTLLHCMAGLDRPTFGHVYVAGLDIGTLDDARLTHLRRNRMGFVFQTFNLVPTLTAAENITLPADLSGRQVDKNWFDYLVGHLGLSARLAHRPSELSGGQRQRVACARALINKPDIVFADEPTGNLDSTAAAEVLSFFCWSVAELGQSIVMVTHDPHVAAYADRVVFLSDGKVKDQLDAPTDSAILERTQGLGVKRVRYVTRTSPLGHRPAMERPLLP